MGQMIRQFYSLHALPPSPLRGYIRLQKTGEDTFLSCRVDGEGRFSFYVFSMSRKGLSAEKLLLLPMKNGCYEGVLSKPSTLFTVYDERLKRIVLYLWLGERGYVDWSRIAQMVEKLEKDALLPAVQEQAEDETLFQTPPSKEALPASFLVPSLSEPIISESSISEPSSFQPSVGVTSTQEVPFLTPFQETDSAQAKQPFMQEPPLKQPISPSVSTGNAALFKAEVTVLPQETIEPEALLDVWASSPFEIDCCVQISNAQEKADQELAEPLDIVFENEPAMEQEKVGKCEKVIKAQTANCQMVHRQLLEPSIEEIEEKEVERKVKIERRTEEETEKDSIETILDTAQNAAKETFVMNFDKTAQQSLMNTANAKLEAKNPLLESKAEESISKEPKAGESETVTEPEVFGSGESGAEIPVLEEPVSERLVSEKSMKEGFETKGSDFDQSGSMKESLESLLSEEADLNTMAEKSEAEETYTAETMDLKAFESGIFSTEESVPERKIEESKEKGTEERSPLSLQELFTFCAPVTPFEDKESIYIRLRAPLPGLFVEEYLMGLRKTEKGQEVGFFFPSPFSLTPPETLMDFSYIVDLNGCGYWHHWYAYTTL